jgi:hypothetical protein
MLHRIVWRFGLPHGYQDGAARLATLAEIRTGCALRTIAGMVERSLKVDLRRSTTVMLPSGVIEVDAHDGSAILFGVCARDLALGAAADGIACVKAVGVRDMALIAGLSDLCREDRLDSLALCWTGPEPTGFGQAGKWWPLVTSPRDAKSGQDGEGTFILLAAVDERGDRPLTRTPSCIEPDNAVPAPPSGGRGVTVDAELWEWLFQRSLDVLLPLPRRPSGDRPD